MDCKITSTKRAARSRAGFTLPEAIMACGVTAVLILTLCSFSMFAGRSFVALFNYVDLNDCNRIAMDQLSRDIRQSHHVEAFNTNSITLMEADGVTQIVYTYSPSTRILSRNKGGVPKPVLKECDKLRFDVCQRNPIGGTYDVIPRRLPKQPRSLMFPGSAPARFSAERKTLKASKPHGLSSESKIAQYEDHTQ